MDIGVDINSDWSLNENGDLSLVRDEDNLSQAIINRLGCYQPSLEVYYTMYGGFLSEYFGRKQTDETLKFMKIELDTILSQEERISSFTSTLSYNGDGSVRVDLDMIVNDVDVELNLVLSRDGGVSVAGLGYFL